MNRFNIIDSVESNRIQVWSSSKSLVLDNWPEDMDLRDQREGETPPPLNIGRITASKSVLSFSSRRRKVHNGWATLPPIQRPVSTHTFLIAVSSKQLTPDRQTVPHRRRVLRRSVLPVHHLMSSELPASDCSVPCDCGSIGDIYRRWHHMAPDFENAHYAARFATIAIYKNYIAFYEVMCYVL